MALTTLTCDTLGDLAGGVARALIDREIQRAISDLEDRGEEDGKIRKVVIQVEMGFQGGLVITTVAAEAKLPPRRTSNTAADLRRRRDGSCLLFQQHDPENPAQQTFPELDEAGD